jgi:hypothetical protein
MALMYPWATKEYLLWEMTIGQILLYHNKGMEIRSGKDTSSGLLGKSAKELRQMRDEARRIFEAEGKAQLRAKYGDI